ncbi:hypothetical protein BASA62_005142 [Batrachochytrium salamandrivorans]|nr:hypothetical protein BASA62_005142 [Batrachochytrium salamandrivorans]
MAEAKPAQVSHPLNADHSAPVFTLYRRRFLIALSVLLGNAANAALWSTYATVTPSAKTYFGTSSFLINLLSLVFLIWYIPISPLASWCLDVKGLRIGILMGCWLTVLGAAIRWLGGYFDSPGVRYSITLVGQSVASIAQPLLLDAPSIVTAHWYGGKERTIANTVISLGQPIGSAIVLLISPSIIGSDPSNFATLNLVLLILSVICAIPSIWVVDRPRTPPSFSAQTQHTPFIQGVRSLVKNRAYVVLWIIFSGFLGIFNTYITLISEYVVPFGYSQDQAGNLGVATISIGLASAAAFGVILDRTKAYSLALQICCVIVTIGTIVFLLGLRSANQYPILVLGSALFGVGGFPLVPVVLEAAVEVTFPIAPGTSAGFLMWGGQIAGIIILLISNAIRGP